MTFSTIGTDKTTNQPVYLYKASRTQGLYIIGATGTGKSGLLENLINDDTKQGTGVIVIDPHGDLIKKVIARLRNKDELDRVILIDPLDIDYSPGINIYQCDNPLDDTQVEQAKERVLHIFTLSARERGDESLGVRVSQGILNSAYTLIDSSPVYGGTMLELPILFTEDIPRRNMVKQVEGKDDGVVDYWKFYETYDKDGKRDRADMVVNKIQEYQMNRFMRRIIGQSKTTINFRTVIDSNPGKIVLVKLRRDHPELAKLIGSLVIAQILGAALSREREGSERRQVHIYADEFQLYATEDFTFLLTECRKYGMAVTVAHQSRDFIDLKNKAATLQAVNLITFRVIRKDADEVAGNYDTTPPPAETRYEYIRTPMHKPVDFIVSGKSHPNEVVNTMLRKWKGVVETANESIRDIRIPAGTGKWGRQEYDFVSNESVIRDTQDHLQLMNDLLYKVMLEKNPRQAVPIALVYWMAKTFGLPFFDYNRYSQLQEYLYKKRMNEIRWGETQYCEKRFCKGDCGKAVHCDFNSLINSRNGYRMWYGRLLPCPDLADFYPLRDYFSFLLDTVAWGEERKRTEEDIKLYVMLWLVEDNQFEAVLALYEQHIRSMLRRDLLYPVPHFFDDLYIAGEGSPGFHYSHEENQDFPDPKHIYDLNAYPGIERVQKLYACEWLQLDFTSLQWEKADIKAVDYTRRDGYDPNELEGLSESGKKWIMALKLPDVEYHYHKWLWMLKSGQVTPEVIEPFLQAEIDRIVAEQKPAFEIFVKQLREVMQALVTQPLEDISGVAEEKPVGQITSDEMRNRIANELATQQNRIAKVRVLDKDNHIVEHTIRTKDIEQGVYGKALDDRLTYIRNRMIDPVNSYWRAKADVDAEIAQRQAKLRQPAQPQVREVPQLLQRQRRYPVEPQPVQQTTSDSQLEQELMKLWDQAKTKGLTSLKFEEWREQEEQILLIDWLKKIKGN